MTSLSVLVFLFWCFGFKNQKCLVSYSSDREFRTVSAFLAERQIMPCVGLNIEPESVVVAPRVSLVVIAAKRGAGQA